MKEKLESLMVFFFMQTMYFFTIFFTRCNKKNTWSYERKKT